MIDHLEIESTVVLKDSEEGRKTAQLTPSLRTVGKLHRLHRLHRLDQFNKFNKNKVIQFDL